MINFIRDDEVPSSLTTDEIKEYIALSVEHINDPTNVPKPDKPAYYRSSDLLEAFDRCFFGKCYLTEQKYSNCFPMDIEHFIPQVERGDLVFEWTNLFPADHNANMMKPRTTPPGGYLNPCDENDDVENEIVYTLDVYGSSPRFEARDIGNAKAVNTARLLMRLHNGHDYNTQRSTESLRHTIQKKYISILNKIVEWQHSTEGSQEKFQTHRDLKDLLSREAAFTMLCRSMPAVARLPADIFD